MKKSHALTLLGAMLLAGCASVPTEDMAVDAQADPRTNLRDQYRIS